MSLTLHLRLLGGFHAQRGETELAALAAPRLQSLLAYLVLHRDMPQPRARLAYTFWLDSTDAQALTNLRNLLYQLRNTLPDAELYVTVDRATVQWRGDADFDLDVVEFENALARAASLATDGDEDGVQEALEEAVSLYTGDLLPGCYDEWILPVREGLRQTFIETLDRLITIVEQRRAYGAAIGHTRRLLAHDPLRESTYRRLMRLHAIDGDRAAALQVYHSCAAVLERELAVEPSTPTRAVYERLLSDEVLPPPSRPSVGMIGNAPLVGRDRDWARLQGAWRTAAAGKPLLALISGDVGVGKTRLAEELLQWARRQGFGTAAARCYAAEGGLAYSPVAGWLRSRPLSGLDSIWLSEVGRVLPEVLAERPDLPRPAPLTEGWQRGRLFQALARALVAGGKPLLLVLDDLQWCDRDTMEWIRYLLRYDAQAALLMVGTLREGEAGDNLPLEAFLQALRREGQIVEIELQPLTESETAELSQGIAGKPIDADLAARIYTESEGYPLFVVEMVRAWLSLDANGKTAGSLGSGCLPPVLQTALDTRLAQLSPEARDLAELAATIGRYFSFGLLAEATAIDESVLLRSLDELWHRRVIREQGGDRYDFNHGKLREAAYGGLSGARRRLLHRRVGQALERHHAADLDGVSREVAAHYERGRLSLQAIPHYQRAATVARRFYSNEEAVDCFRRALQLLADVPEQEVADARWQQTAWELREGLGDVLALTGHHQEAREAFQSGLAYLAPDSLLARARLHRKSAQTWREQRQYDEGLRACECAERTLEADPASRGTGWWQEWLKVQMERIWIRYWLAQWREMTDLVERCKPVVEKYGALPQRIAFFGALCLMSFRRDRYVMLDETLDYARSRLAISQESEDPSQIADSQGLLGIVHLCRGDLDEAEKDLEAGLKGAVHCGNAWLHTICLTYRTVVARRRGRVGETQAYIARSLAAAEAGEMADYIAAARANQAWLAWRQRSWPEVEVEGRAALVAWQESPLVYPFQWLALWPLLGASLTLGQLSDCTQYARQMLAPTQQKLPDEMAGLLERAVEADERALSGVAQDLLQQATELAQEMGYL